MFKNAVNLFEIAGFKIRIDPSWFLIAALIVWSLTAAYFPAQLPGRSQYEYLVLSISSMLGLFASLILHELSHSLVARRFELEVGGITLFIFGGVAELEQEPESARSEFWIAIAGPAMSFALALVFYLVAAGLENVGASDLLTAAFSYLWFINLLLALFNMVPAFPLDGGRIFRAALWYLWHDLLWATRIASGSGMVFGIFLVVSGILSLLTTSSFGGLWQILIGFFIVSASRASYQQLLIKTALRDHTVRSLMTAAPITADIEDSIEHTVNETMLKHSLSFVPTLENDRLLGYVDLAHVRQVERDKWPTTGLRDILVPCDSTNTVSGDMPVDKLFGQMVQKNQRKMMVARAGDLEGVISLTDLMSYLAIRQELGFPENTETTTDHSRGNEKAL